jgi:hypothetical protein
MTASLEPAKKSRRGAAMIESPGVRCTNCLCIYPPACIKCPECGELNESKIPKHNAKKELEEIIDKREPWEREIVNLIATAKNRGLKKGWIFHAMKTKFGEEIAKHAWDTKVKHLKVWASREEKIQSLMPNLDDLPPPF